MLHRVLDSRVFVLPYPQQLTVYAKYPFHSFEDSVVPYLLCAAAL